VVFDRIFAIFYLVSSFIFLRRK